MKTSRNSLAAPTLALFSALFFTGCYTQFVLDDRETDEETYAQPAFDEQPGCILWGVDVPIWIPALPAPILPVAGSGGNAPGKTESPPKRDSGKQRVPPVPTIPSQPPSRSGGTTAPAPAPSAPVTVAPAPAPPAPAHSPESRPAGGSGTRK